MVPFFTPGRQTRDNIIMTQEMIHTIRWKTGKDGHMILKIDLEKAYDRVSWKVLEETLHYFGLYPTWIHITMHMIAKIGWTLLSNQKPPFWTRVLNNKYARVNSTHCRSSSRNSSHT